MRLGVAAFGTDGAKSGIGSYLRQWLEAFDSSDPAIDMDFMAPRSEKSTVSSAPASGPSPWPVRP